MRSNMAPTPRQSTASIRLTVEEKQEMEMLAEELGFRTISEYLGHLHSGQARRRENAEEYVVSDGV